MRAPGKAYFLALAAAGRDDLAYRGSMAVGGLVADRERVEALGRDAMRVYLKAAGPAVREVFARRDADDERSRKLRRDVLADAVPVCPSMRQTYTRSR